jgi:hypothetical protein
MGKVPCRFAFIRARERIYHHPKPFRFVSALHAPEVAERGVDYVLADRFPVEIGVLRVYFDRDGIIPDLAQAFNPPIVLADGDLFEPTIPADLPLVCDRET